MHVSYPIFNDPRDIDESSEQWIFSSVRNETHFLCKIFYAIRLTNFYQREYFLGK